MDVYLCGAVADILEEFARKIGRYGLRVVAADEWTHHQSRAYRLPLNVDAAILGTDQTSHSATDSVILECKRRGLPFAVGPLRKWSLIKPKLVQAGILPGD
jgi:hypothetical protein